MNPDTLHRSDPASNPPQAPSIGQPAESTGPASTSSPYQEVTEAAGEQIRQVAADLKDSGGEALQTAKEAGTNFLDEQKEKFAARIDHYKDAVKAACDTLNTTDANPLVSPAQRASHQMERAAEYLRGHTAADLLDDLGNFARRRPEIVFGAMFVAGLASVRFLKASARERRGSPGNNGNGSSSYPAPRSYQPASGASPHQLISNPNLLK